MQSKLFHLVWHIKDFQSNSFLFKEFFRYLEIPIWNEGEDYFAVDVNGLSIWFQPTTNDTTNNRDSYGMEHVAFIVDEKADVDRFVHEFLRPNNIQPLFDTPREREEYNSDTTGYYQVMFELPGGILVELMTEEKTTK